MHTPKKNATCNVMVTQKFFAVVRSDGFAAMHGQRPRLMILYCGKCPARSFQVNAKTKSRNNMKLHLHFHLRHPGKALKLQMGQSRTRWFASYPPACRIWNSFQCISHSSHQPELKDKARSCEGHTPANHC